jgi:hypothetical protein
VSEVPAVSWRPHGAEEALHSWLDSWHGIGMSERGMYWQGDDLQLKRYNENGWRCDILLGVHGALSRVLYRTAWEVFVTQGRRSIG